MFGYEMVLPMNTGAEGVETALKLARKWSYEKKKIPKDEAIIISCCGCFHGRTLAVISMSCDNEATCGFRPLLPRHVKVDFGDAVALEKIFKEHRDRIAGFLVESIEGEAGVIIPPEGYPKAVRDLCSKYNILMIADEKQSGLARSGKMLACDWEEVHPDVVVLGKALGGGVITVSAVLADRYIMLCIRPGEHGRTSFPFSAYDIYLKMKERGALAKPTHETTVWLTPPLCMSPDELPEGSKVLRDVLELDLTNMLKAKPKQSPTTPMICDHFR